MLRRRGNETVILAGADPHGMMRGLPIAELDRAAERGIALCDVIWALAIDEVEPVQPPPELERSALARDWLGDDVVDHCVAMRRAELAAQAAAVIDWETSRYLEAL